MPDNKKVFGALPRKIKRTVPEQSGKRAPKMDGPLPTNIERATPDYVRENLSKWDQEVLKRRAARLSVPLEEAAGLDNKPLLILEAEQRAKAEGVPVDKILDRYAEEYLRSGYPTAECFLPDEIVEYIQRGSLPDRMDHTDNCPACSMLLGTILPKNFDDMLQSGAVATKAEKELNKSEAGGNKGRLLRYVHTFTDTGVIFLPMLILAVGYGIFRLFDRGTTSRTVPSDARTWIIAFVGTFFCLVALRALYAFPKVRSWTTASIVGLVFIGFLYVDYSQSKSNTAANVALAFKWAQSGTESLGVKAIQQFQQTGKFPTPKQATEIVGAKMKNPEGMSVASKVTNQEATYTITATDLQGKLVAEVEPTGGEITWEEGGKVLSQIQLLIGTVKDVSADDSNNAAPTVTFEDGHSYSLINSDGIALPSPGERVVAAVDPKTYSVENYRVISRR